MQLIIDIDTIDDPSKKEWLINTLKLMHIDFDTKENRQTIEEYNLDIAYAEAEVESGVYIIATDLRQKAASW